MAKLTVYDHPLIKHKITRLRDKNVDSKLFRELVNEVASLMIYEVTRELPVIDVEVETPLMTCKGYQVSGDSIAVVPVLRAGLGMMDGIMNVIPMARVGHIGLYRDPKSLKPVEYYCKLPGSLEEKFVILADPMLATGFSAAAAIDLLKKNGAKKIVFACILAAPEGVKALSELHPDVDVYTAAYDEKLNENGYIVPGLGDAGDRIFGTK
ncbi:MAG: uracil phosphoribosyltransferase [Candidatus Cloacimonadota bacterium]|nr:MAG: uracil phosphoribosyltransferase [Candidatus Cloacimonadota bacterium]